MSTKPDLEISVDLDQDIDPQKLDQFTRQLHQDIARIEVDSVERAKDDKPLEGTEKGWPVDVNTLLVTLSSASAIVTLIQLVQPWALRAEGRKVKIRVEDEAIEFEYSPTAASKDELMAFAEGMQQLLKDKGPTIHLP